MTGRAHNKFSSDRRVSCGGSAGSSASGSATLDGRRRRSTIVLLLVIVSVTAYRRVSTALNTSQLWIMHPDEVYQGVEVAHGENYGYGFRPYEYLAPPQDELAGGGAVSEADRQRLHLGMHALRSFLYPRLYQLLLYLHDITITLNLHLLANPYLVLRCFHCMMCSLLPVSIYWLCSSMESKRSHLGPVLCALLVACNEHLTVLGGHTLINGLLSVVTYTGLAMLLHAFKFRACHQWVQEIHLNQNNYSPSMNEPPKKSSVYNRRTKGLSLEFVISAFIVTLCIYIRPDSGLTILAVILAATDRVENLLTSVTLSDWSLMLTGSLTALFIGGHQDHVTYNYWFSSPINWFNFNVITDQATTIFGESHMLFYVNQVLLWDYFYGVFNIMVPVTLLWSGDSRYRRLFSIVCILLVMYSIKGHKEVRFVHDVIVLICILHARALEFCYTLLKNRLGLSLFKNGSASAVISSVLIVTMLGLRGTDTPRRYGEWVYGGEQAIQSSADINGCLLWLSRQRGVTGVFIDHNIYHTGGYTLLHHNVPILASTTSGDYREWIPQWAHHKLADNLTRFDDVTEYFAKSNKRSLISHLMLSRRYDFFIIDKRLPSLSGAVFQDVYSSGYYLVKQLNLTSPLYYKAMDTLSKAEGPMESSLDILEYEASWLMTLTKQPLQSAVERLETVLERDPQHSVRAYQLLWTAYHKLDKLHKYRIVYQKCIDVFRKNQCLQMTNTQK